MRPEITKNNSGKSPYAFSKLKQTTILNILNVIIMMRMAYASFKQFYENVTRACYEASVTVVERKGASAMNLKVMPWQHFGSGNSIVIPMQKEVMGACHARMVGCSRLRGSHMSVAR